MNAPQSGLPEHPSSDKRFKMLDIAIRRQGRDPEALIEILHIAQELFGCLAPDLLHYVSHALDVPPSKVYGVATFYNFFSLTPKGRHTCLVCLGTACYVKHAGEILHTLEKEFNVQREHTTPDGEFSLSVARCFGSCSLAPVVILDGQMLGQGTPESVLEKVEAIMGVAGSQ